MFRTLADLDAELFDAIARSDSPILDSAMRPLTHAADHSKLWFGIAAAMVATRNTTATRAALRGLGTLAVTSLLTNQGAKRIHRRRRPVPDRVPPRRRALRQPTSSSLPSGHSASAAAFAIAVASEHRPTGVALGALAGLVGLSRVATGVHYPADVAIGFGIGTAVALVGARLVQPKARTPQPIRPHELADLSPDISDGTGLVVVINAASGSADDAVGAEIRRSLPRAETLIASSPDDIPSLLDDAARRGIVLGVAGGDGTIAAAAAVAHGYDRPLAVFPTGTYNHFARDLGLTSVTDGIDAVRHRRASRIDVVWLNDQLLILNTASIGAYPYFVRTRTRVEHLVRSRHLAGAIALVRTYRRAPRVRIRLSDGTVVETSLFVVGNSEYRPSGFAVARRQRLDDGRLDVRFLAHTHHGGTVRLIIALLTGGLTRSALYHSYTVEEFVFTAVDGPVVVAHDGEIGDACSAFRFTVDPRALTVVMP